MLLGHDLSFLDARRLDAEQVPPTEAEVVAEH
jgi:hypothetical protein